MASSLIQWTFPFCGPAASEASLGQTIRLDPKDFSKSQVKPTRCHSEPTGSKPLENSSSLPSISAAAMAVQETQLRLAASGIVTVEAVESSGAPAESTASAEVPPPESTPECSTMVVTPRCSSGPRMDLEPVTEPKEVGSPEVIAAAEALEEAQAHELQDISTDALKSKAVAKSEDGPAQTPQTQRSAGFLVSSPLPSPCPAPPEEEPELAAGDEATASAAASPRVVPGSVEPEAKAEEIEEEYLEDWHDEDEAIQAEEPEPAPEKEEEDAEFQSSESALAEANAHLQRIEAELRAHRELVAQEAEARASLEAALAAERARAEVEAQGRRKLEEKIEAEERRIEDEKRKAREAEEEAARLEEEKRLEEELAVARRRAEEEARLAAQRSEEQRKTLERQRRREEAEVVARKSARQAKNERESRERAKLFLAAEGFRHVRASRKWSPVSTYPLHRAVKLNNAEMVRLLLWVGADSNATNVFRQTPLRLAKWRNKQGSHAEVIAVLEAGKGAPLPEESES